MTSQLPHGAATDIGRARRTNEDAYVADPPLFAVADGMGGHLAGDVAAATAVKVLSREVRDAGDALVAAVKAANQAVHRQAKSDPKLSGMGTTMTAMLAGPTSIQIVHVGDSRAYLLRDGNLRRLTRDHTVADRLAREGKIRAEEADRHPQRSVLERAIGVYPDVSVDVEVVDVRPGDRIVLCTDGLTSMLTDPEILDVLLAESDPETASRRLCDEAVRAGGSDNVTAVVVDYPREGARGEATAVSLPEAGGDGSRPPNPAPLPSRTAAASGTAGVPRRRRAPVRALVALLLLAAVGAAGLLLGRLALSNSWYVGASDGRVAVFRGVPGSVAGFRFASVTERTDIAVSTLPTVYQRRLEEGITAGSRAQAGEIVEGIRDLRLQEAGPPSPASPTPSPGYAP